MTILLNGTLRLSRQFSNESLENLAEHFNTSVEFLRNIETDGNSVPINWLEKYAAYFDVPVEHLLLFEVEIPTDTYFANKVRLTIAKSILKYFEWSIKRGIKKGVFTDEQRKI